MVRLTFVSRLTELLLSRSGSVIMCMNLSISLRVSKKKRRRRSVNIFKKDLLLEQDFILEDITISCKFYAVTSGFYPTIATNTLACAEQKPNTSNWNRFCYLPI